MRQIRAIIGQLDSIKRKAETVMDEEIDCCSYCRDDENEVYGKQEREILKTYYKFRNECHRRLERFSGLHYSYFEKIQAIFLYNNNTSPYSFIKVT